MTSFRYKEKRTVVILGINFHVGGASPTLPKHWSNEQTMLEYVDDVIVPYVERTREFIDDNKPALDNFKGQVMASVTRHLEECDIHTCLLPPNTPANGHLGK